MVDQINYPIVYTYVLPVTIPIIISVIILALWKTPRETLFNGFPKNPYREVRWGISATVTGISYFVFGIALSVLTFALSPIGGATTMGLAIAFGTVAILMLIYTFGLMIHYYRQSKTDKYELSATKSDISDFKTLLQQQHADMLQIIERMDKRIELLEERNRESNPDQTNP